MSNEFFNFPKDKPINIRLLPLSPHKPLPKHFIALPGNKAMTIKHAPGCPVCALAKKSAWQRLKFWLGRIFGYGRVTITYNRI